MIDMSKDLSFLIELKAWIIYAIVLVLIALILSLHNIKHITIYTVFDENDLVWLEEDYNISKEDIPKLKYGEIDIDYNYMKIVIVDDYEDKIIGYYDKLHNNVYDLICKIDFQFKYKYVIDKKYIYIDDLKNMIGDYNE